MIVAVMFSHAEKEGMEVNRRPAKNYYRDACMARGLRGKVSLPATFQEPSGHLLGDSVTRPPFLWLITFDMFSSRYLPGASGTLELCILHGQNVIIEN